jgi:biopolymer transport protein ExbB
MRHRAVPDPSRRPRIFPAMLLLLAGILGCLAGPVAAQDLPTADAGAAQTIRVENPYGLQAILEQGDVVARGTFVILALMSVATWCILVVKLIEQHRLLREAKLADRKFWTSPDVASGMQQLTQGGPFWYIAERGVSADAHHEGTMVEQIDRSTWITMSVNRAVDAIQSKLTAGLAVLATVGSTAPFVGLFGTVWGIYHALTQIGISGQASIDKVAGPVGEALIMTAIGLAVAVPAVLGYNWLVRRNKNAMDRVRAFASDLHSVLLSGARVGERRG